MPKLISYVCAPTNDKLLLCQCARLRSFRRYSRFSIYCRILSICRSFLFRQYIGPADIPFAGNEKGAHFIASTNFALLLELSNIVRAMGFFAPSSMINRLPDHSTQHQLARENGEWWKSKEIKSNEYDPTKSRYVAFDRSTVLLERIKYDIEMPLIIGSTHKRTQSVCCRLG